jgi:hypothetical protein
VFRFAIQFSGKIYKERVSVFLSGAGMATKKKAGAEKIATELAALALRHLSSFSAEEQEKRILAAKKRLANAARAGRSRTSSSTSRTRKNWVSARGR